MTRSNRTADEVAGELDRLYKVSPHQGVGDLVFAHPLTGGPLPKANVTRRMRAALKAANLDSSHRFHDLRHTFGTRMAAAGVPMRTRSGRPDASPPVDLVRARLTPYHRPL